MNQEGQPSPSSSDLQLFYARIMDGGAKLGFVLLLVTFVIYVTGLLAPYVSLEEVPRYWSGPVAHYLKATRLNPGWTWVDKLKYGDFLNYFPIALMAGVIILGYLGLLWRFLRQGETIPSLIVVLQLLVLALAASGFLRAGGY